MKFYPKNRNIKNTFKHNRGSEGRGSLSKSVSRDEVFEQVSGQGSRSHKGPNKGNDNLLKQSIKNHQKMSLKEKGVFPVKRVSKQEASYRSGASYNGFRTYSHEAGTFDPISNAERYQRGTGGDFVNSIFTNYPQADYYSDRPEHIAPRHPAHSGSFAGDLKNYSNNHYGFIDKRSRSVHIYDKAQDSESGEPTASKFKKKDNELNSWQQGGMDNSEDSVDFEQMNHLQPSRQIIPSRFNNKYAQGPQAQPPDRSPPWEGYEEQAFQEKTPAEQNERRQWTYQEKLKELVNNLVED